MGGEPNQYDDPQYDPQYDPQRDPQRDPNANLDWTKPGSPDFAPGSPDIQGSEWDIQRPPNEAAKDEKGNKDGARSALGHPPIGSPGPETEGPTPSKLGALASPGHGASRPQRPSPGEDDGSYDLDPERPNRPGDPDPVIPARQTEDGSPR